MSMGNYNAIQAQIAAAATAKANAVVLQHAKTDPNGAEMVAEYTKPVGRWAITRPTGKVIKSGRTWKTAAIELGLMSPEKAPLPAGGYPAASGAFVQTTAEWDALKAGKTLMIYTPFSRRSVRTGGTGNNPTYTVKNFGNTWTAAYPLMTIYGGGLHYAEVTTPAKSARYVDVISPKTKKPMYNPRIKTNVKTLVKAQPARYTQRSRPFANPQELNNAVRQWQAAQNDDSGFFDVVLKVVKVAVVVAAVYFTAGAASSAMTAGSAGAGASAAGAAGVSAGASAAGVSAAAAEVGAAAVATGTSAAAVTTGFSLSGTIAAGATSLGASAGVASAVGTIGAGVVTSIGGQLMTTGKVDIKQALTSGVIGYGIGFAGDYVGKVTGGLAQNIGLPADIAAKVATGAASATVAAGTEFIQSGKVTAKAVVMAGLSASMSGGTPSTIAGVKVSDIIATGKGVKSLIAARAALAAQRKQGQDYARQAAELATLDAEILALSTVRADATPALAPALLDTVAPVIITDSPAVQVPAKSDTMPVIAAALVALKLIMLV